MQPRRAGVLQRDVLPEHPQPALGGVDSQLSEVWSQATELDDEGGEFAARSLGRADEGEIVTGGGDDGATRRLGERLARGDGSLAHRSRVGDVSRGGGAVLN